MRISRLVLMAAVLASAVCGCRKGGEAVETPEPNEAMSDSSGAAEANAPAPAAERKEAAMGVKLKWLGHASFRISLGAEVIYIDPWKIDASAHDATIVLVSHAHQDHYSPADIAKVSGAETELIASVDVVAKEKGGEGILPGLMIEIRDIRIKGVPAYNVAKEFHPRRKNWVGFVIESGDTRIYYAGDTDLTDEMKALQGIDLALLPVGGTYTMDAGEAAEATRQFKPAAAIPYHWGDIVGAREDAERFAESAACEVKVLSPGETAEF